MRTMRTGFTAARNAALAVLLVLGVAASSQASPLDVPLQPYPAILAGFITTTYNSATGDFRSEGWTQTLDTGSGQQSFTNKFLLTAKITTAGVATSGSLAITPLTAGSTPLLASTTLTAFGFDKVVGGTLEFLFAPVTGSLVAPTGGLYTPDKPIDVMIKGLGLKFPGNFTTSWSSSSNTAQIMVDPPLTVPEPATLLMFALGAGGIGYLRRRQSARG